MYDNFGSGNNQVNIEKTANFQENYSSDLFYDNKITWGNAKSLFISEYGLDNILTNKRNMKIFGIPWYLYPELQGRNIDNLFNNTGHIRGKKNYQGSDINNLNGSGLNNVKSLIKSRIIDSTVTVRTTQRNKDPYGNILRKIQEFSGGLSSILTFITTKQWNNREVIHEDLETKQISLYTDLITEETHNNVQYSISNTVSTNEVKNFGEVMLEMIKSIPVVGSLYEYGVDYGFKGLMGEGTTGDIFGGIYSFHNFSKMISRETINLWRSGKQLMTTKFEFNFRASSYQTLDEFFVPVLFLTQVQQPNSVKDVGGSSGFEIVEKVPPIPVDIIIGDPNNPIINLRESIITNLHIEVYDYKYLNSSFSNINNILDNNDVGENDSQVAELLGIQGKNMRVPTQQRVKFDIEPITPIVQFSEMLSKQSEQNNNGNDQIQ